jgi:hypothetical protein
MKIGHGLDGAHRLAMGDSLLTHAIDPGSINVMALLIRFFLQSSCRRRRDCLKKAGPWSITPGVQRSTTIREANMTGGGIDRFIVPRDHTGNNHSANRDAGHPSGLIEAA